MLAGSHITSVPVLPFPPPPAALFFYCLESALKRKIKSPGEAEAELKYTLLQWESLDLSLDTIPGHWSATDFS